ncbi:TPA: hypothetical protein DD394_03475 [bacterium UBP9_UBA11836]|nr:hypothetical protein [bacterium UBP9_UBA11836]
MSEEKAFLENSVEGDNPYIVSPDQESTTDSLSNEESDSSLEHAPLFHKRATPLPNRIKSGYFTEEALVGETSSDTIEVPWDSIEHVALGMIIERSEQDASAYKMQKLVKNFSRMAQGNVRDDDKDKIVTLKPTNFLDIYSSNREEPLRFDSSSINYRSFLKEKLSHVSFQNFFRLVREICQRSQKAYFTESVQAFLAWKRDKVKTYNTVHDFEHDTFLCFSRGRHLVAWSDLDFTRTGWADGWQEDSDSTSASQTE